MATMCNEPCRGLFHNTKSVFERVCNVVSSKQTNHLFYFWGLVVWVGHKPRGWLLHELRLYAKSII